MQSKRLAQWLQDHSEMLGHTKNQQDKTFHTALYEGLIDLALSGDSRLIDSVVESSAAHAVAVGRELTDLLGVHQALRRRIWKRIGEEIDPEPAFVMLSALDEIFVHVIRETIDAYQLNNKLAQAAKSQEISRLYAEAEERVMQYATEMSRANRELARLEQAKTDFISIAAHELKTPLTLIQGYVNILHDINPDERNQKLTRGIDRGVRRMNSILDDMLDLSAMDMRRIKLVIQNISPLQAIELILKQVKRTLAERQQSIITKNLETLPIIQADISRLHQILKQLISNAIKYTPDGGQIIIEGATAPDKIILQIHDNGVGIAPEDREKIFEKFYRAADSSRHSTGPTKFMGAGPGLGLAIVRGLVEAHGGRVFAESPGFDMHNHPGSSFTIELPLQAAPAADIDVTWIDVEPPAPAEARSQSEPPAAESLSPAPPQPTPSSQSTQPTQPTQEELKL